MRSTWKVFAFAVVTLSVSNLYAQEAPKTDDESALKAAFEQVKEVEVKEAKTVVIVNNPSVPAPVTVEPEITPAPEKKLRNAYITASFGVGTTMYGGSAEDDMDTIEDAVGDRQVIALDAGVYVPVEKHKLLIGGVFDCVSDQFGESDGDHYFINSYLIGLSAMHYFGDTPTEGVFMRADVGLAWYYTEFKYEDKINHLSYDQSNDTDFGYGYLIGGGYVFGAGVVGVKLEANFQTRVVEDDGEDIVGHAATLNLGIIF